MIPLDIMLVDLAVVEVDQKKVRLMVSMVSNTGGGGGGGGVTPTPIHRGNGGIGGSGIVILAYDT